MSEPQRGPSRAASRRSRPRRTVVPAGPPPAWELGAFRLSVALVGLHVVDDRFLQPEPGVSRADHLVSGVVPLLVLTAVAVVYARLRAGWRVICALALGVLGLAASSEAVYYTREVGPSGDDYTGLLAIPAALALLAIGTVVLWRSRRREGLAPAAVFLVYGEEGRRGSEAALGGARSGPHRRSRHQARGVRAAGGCLLRRSAAGLSCGVPAVMTSVGPPLRRLRRRRTWRPSRA